MDTSMPAAPAAPSKQQHQHFPQQAMQFQQESAQPEEPDPAIVAIMRGVTEAQQLGSNQHMRWVRRPHE